MINKRITIIVALIGVLLVTALGTSFALFEKVQTQEGNNTISTYNCLDVTITGGDAISISAAYPIKDEEGVLQTPYTFTVTNNCDHFIGVDLGVEYQATSTIAPSLIKAAISKGHDGIMPKLLSNYKLFETINVETETNPEDGEDEGDDDIDDDIDDETDPTTNPEPQVANQIHRYKMEHVGLPANDSQTFEYRMWLDYSAENLTSSDKVDVKILASETVRTEEAAPDNWWTSNTINGSTTLLKAIRTDNIIRTPLTEPGKAINLENEALIASTEDDYGLSYYYRGNVNNNYVLFAEKCWKIVRVDGLGNIKLILWNDDNNCDGKEPVRTGAFNSRTYTKSDGESTGDLYQTASGVGFMYGKPDSTTLYTNPDPITGAQTGAQDNISKSTILGYLETWYGNNINKVVEENSTEKYSDYLADVIWCGDKSRSSGPGYGQLGEARSYFSARARIRAEDNIANAKPTLICPDEGLEGSPTISKYTMEATKENKGNGDLDYPIGLITADEVAFAGGAFNKSNRTYYLYTGLNSHYWTMSPNCFDASLASIWIVNDYGVLYAVNVSGKSGGVRPTVSLKSTTTISSGNGTAQSPYVINGVSA